MKRSALFLTAAMLLVGSNVGVGKSIVEFIPVSLLALLRFAIAVVVMAPAYLPRHVRHVNKRHSLQLFTLGLFGAYLFILLMVGGAARTSAVAAGVITSSLPAVVALSAWALLGERPGVRSGCAIVLAVIGVVIINVGQATSVLETTALEPNVESSLEPSVGPNVESSLDPSLEPNVGPGFEPASPGANALDTSPGAGEPDWLGNLMVLGAVGCEAVFVVLSRRLVQSLTAFQVCAYTHLAGLGLSLPVGLWTAWDFAWASVPALTWWLLLWYAVSASVFSFWLWMKGVRHMPASLAGAFTAMVPLAAAAYGILVLGEVPTLGHAAACVCVVTGVLLASTAQREQTEPASP